MARKFLYFIAFCIVLYLGGRIALTFYPETLTRIAFTPTAAFEPRPALAANAYADPKMWIAQPGMSGPNPAQWAPGNHTEDADALGAGVFFVHPTSYLKKAHWNDPLDDPEARQVAETMVRANASVFNKAPAVWAPRYRQATLGAFVSDKAEAHKALDLAYRDVALAFDVFIAAQPAQGPIVLAGHSQGSYHLKRLLAEKVKGTPLERRVVAAYVVGWQVDMNSDIPKMGLPACAAPEQTSCVISFMSFTDKADTAMVRAAYERFAPTDENQRGQQQFLCSNPLTGRIGGSAPASANLGTAVPDARMTKAQLTPALAGASCAADGTLRIGKGPDLGPLVLPGGNYHVYDYVLFWANLRADMIRRSRAWRP